MMTDAENRGYWQMTSGAEKVCAILSRNGMHITADKLEIMMLNLRKVVPMLRDVEALAETGCCCGEIRGKRNSRQLCEACEERAGNGGSL